MGDNYVQSSPVLKYTDGTLVATERVGPQGSKISDDLHGELYESSRIGTLFWAANQAAITTTIALALTYTGLALYNPVGNSNNLILRAMSFKFSVAQAAISQISLMGGYISTGAITAHTTPLVYGTAMWPCNLGSTAVPTALVDSAATIVGPKILMPLGGSFTAAALGGDTPSFNNFLGGIILQPGAYIAVYTLTVSIGFAAFWWEEVAR